MSATSADTWVYDHLHQVYFHPLSNTYAIPDPKTGEWSYVPAAQFHAASTSTSRTTAAVSPNENGHGHGSSGGANLNEEKEEGEIEDDVGWGGLMEPDKLAEIEREQAQAKNRVGASKSHQHHGQGPSGSGVNTPLGGLLEKHPAYGGNGYASSNGNGNGTPKDTVVPYDDPKLYAYPSTDGDNDDPNDPNTGTLITGAGEASRPNEILRLVVLFSECLGKGHVALIDTREGGIQIGRDRCERGATPRIRCREMRVSKTHAVIYWGQGSAESDGNERIQTRDQDRPSGLAPILREGTVKDQNKAKGEEEWWIVDLGSTHGTFISPPTAISADPDQGNDTPTTAMTSRKGPKARLHRLSEPKHSSKPYPLTHLSRLTIGSTTFEVHLHPSTSWPCEACQVGKEHNEIPLDDGEPKIALATTIEGDTTGEVDGMPEFRSDVAGQRWAMDSKQKRDNRELKRKREMALLRETLLNKDSPAPSPARTGKTSGKIATIEPGSDDAMLPGPPAREYLDRSAMRRRLHPPSPPSRGRSSPTASERHGKHINPNNIAITSQRPTLATPTGTGPTGTVTPVSSIASGILAAQGWIPGQGLGKDRSGRADPVQAEMRNARAGLGAKGGKAYTDPSAGSGAGAGAGGEGEKMDWKTRAKMRRWDEVSNGV
ncbi:hypothetical protein IAU59_003118 [Kwoniella sp. CBS 9459]